MFACFYIPDFPVQASLLPELAEIRTALQQSHLAILDGPANLPRVFATNSAARRAGIQIGMTKLQVETYGGVWLRKRSIAAEESAQTTLLDYAGTFSPRVESTCPGAAILDLAGMEKLLRTWKKDSWQSAARAMHAQAIEIGFDLRIAIASNPDTAFLAARGFSVHSIHVLIPAGEEAQRLAPLTVNVLPISPEMLEVLESWGIRTFQSLAALPTVAIVERLGQEGLYLQKLAQGQINRPLLTSEPDAEFIESFEFDDPVETLESLFFILNRLLHQLCSKLISAALSAQELRLTIALEVRRRQNDQKEEEQWQHEWKLPFPTQNRNLLFGLVRLQLEKTTFSAPVRKLIAEVVPVRPRVAQGNLFAPPSPEPEKLEITLERIRGVVGSTDTDDIACVGSPSLVDTHKPGSFAVQHFSSAQDPDSPAPRNSSSHHELSLYHPEFSLCHPERSKPMRFAHRLAESKAPHSSQVHPPATVIALRIFRPALETSVELDGDTPHFVRLWHRHRRVLAASGPWSISGSWWNASPWAREEWDVALKTSAGIGFYRIYRDRIRQQWFVEGVFD
jgi:protein ImuB